MAEPKYIDRPPRIQPELPKHEFEIPPPPNKEEGGNQLLIQVALPLLTIIGYVFVAAAGGRSALLLIPMGIAVVGSSALAFYTARRNKQLRAEKEAAYHERLLELRSEMDRYHDAQRRFYNYNYPDPATVLALAATAASQATTTPSPNGQPPQARLWERRTSDGDFGRLRLGIGTLPSTVTYEISQADNFDDPQMRDALRLDNDSRYVSDVPITIPLRQPAGDKVAQDAPPVRHALGIAGNKEAGVYACARAILTHYAAFHAPTDARLYVLGQNKTPWQWATPLPHCQEAKGQTLCFEDDQDREAGKEKSNVYQFLKILRRTLDERKLRLEDQNNRADVTLPFLLIVVDLLRPLPDNSRLKDLESDPAFSLLFEEGVRLGAAVIFLVPTRAQIPGGCNAVVEVTVLEPNADPDPSHRHEVSFIYAEVGVNTPRYVGRADFLPRVEAVTEFARQLSPLTIRKSYGADLPLSVPLLDMLNVSSIEELRQQTLENWERSQKTAEWLKAPIGRLSGGDVRALTLSADADGVHGLVAGSTGSGKSELLMTLILALALHYDPSIINFVLVDFKGGTAFDPFKTLPHCVDIVTNLSTSAVERMFAAIKAELNRRQALNVATESKHIVHYRERGLHAPPYGQSKSIKDKTYSTAPYPHLFIIIDEFAEMIAEKPEFKAELNSITRLGRALGVTLILAAQRPSGVTDQMRANIKFRICLRVETREESSEVLRRPDAAYLPNGVPGRGYLQVGNESIEVVQVAYSGGEYTGAQQSRPKVIWKNRPKAADSSPAEEEAPKLYKVLVDMVKETAQTHSLRQFKPWPDFLPEQLHLQTPLDGRYLTDEGKRLLNVEAMAPPSGEKAAAETLSAAICLNPAVAEWVNGRGYWPGIQWSERAMRPVVGLIDNPYEAVQLPLVVDFRRGHTAVFGASGWGKTTFLRTLITSLATTHSPTELHVYVLDFGGRNLSLFENLPHVGAVITPDEEERVRRLLRKLDGWLEERKKLLSSEGADDLYSYNTNHPQTPLPAVLVVIDNFAELKESYEDLLDSLTSLARESRAYGIHFVASAEQSGSLTNKLFGLFTERMALKQADPSEYTAIVGRGGRVIDDIPGRGLVRVERRALEFQTALPVDLPHLEEGQQLMYLIELMEAVGAGQPAALLPPRIETLPNRIALANLLPPPPPAGRPTPRVAAVMGTNDLDLEPWLLDLPKAGPHFLIIGPPNSGKTTTLRTLILSLAHSFTPDEVTLLLVDFQGRLFHYEGDQNLGDLPHVVATVTRFDQLKAISEKLNQECEELGKAGKPKRRIFLIMDNYDSISAEGQKQRTGLDDLARLAREYGTVGLHVIIAGSLEVARATDELRKQAQSPRYGLGLQTVDAAERLDGRVSRTLAKTELPLGRGFVVKSGRTAMIQVATPYEDDDQIAPALDTWVTAIQQRYPTQKATWLARPPSADGASKPPTAGATSHKSSSMATDGFDVEALKQHLASRNILSADILKSMSADKILETAQGLMDLSPFRKS